MLSTFSLMLLACFSHDPNLPLSKGSLSRLFSQALLICIFSIPVCALLFLIFPRADIPLFGFMNKLTSAKSGFSDSVSLGDVSSIQEDSSPVFRAAMDVIGDQGLYWRGVELDQFDGISWKRSTRDEREDVSSSKSGREMTQIIYLEPYGNRYLFALDRPVAIYPEKARRWRKPENVWSETITRRIRYRAVSVSTDFVPATLIDRDKYVRLPPDFSPRITALAKKVVEEGGDSNPVRSLMKYFRSGEYEYSLESLPISDSPLDEFIFNYRRGNCEYFASALAVMLRSAGIPSRVIGGYRGGYYNNAGKYYLVLQRNAHVWVEAYDAGGWKRLDPTPPGRQNQGVSQSNLFLQLRVLLDTFNYYWDRFVINYDLSDQFALWGNVKSRAQKPAGEFGYGPIGFNGPVAAIPVLALIVLIIILVGRRRRRPEQKLVAQFLRRMVKRGYEKGAGEGLEEFVSRVGEPELREKAQDFVDGFQDVFYRDREFTAEEIRRLKFRIRQM
jgi:transglutaminase-like putative cysteine protease